MLCMGNNNGIFAIRLARYRSIDRRLQGRCSPLAPSSRELLKDSNISVPTSHNFKPSVLSHVVSTEGKEGEFADRASHGVGFAWRSETQQSLQLGFGFLSVICHPAISKIEMWLAIDPNFCDQNAANPFIGRDRYLLTPLLDSKVTW